MSSGKLCVVVRDDLPEGPRAVQACHAALDFAAHHRSEFSGWHSSSNCLLIKSVPDEASLELFMSEVAAGGHRLSAFREPDLGNSLTAVAVSPSARRHHKRLPLAFRQV